MSSYGNDDTSKERRVLPRALFTDDQPETGPNARPWVSTFSNEAKIGSNWNAVHQISALAPTTPQPASHIPPIMLMNEPAVLPLNLPAREAYYRYTGGYLTRCDVEKNQF